MEGIGNLESEINAEIGQRDFEDFDSSVDELNNSTLPFRSTPVNPTTDPQLYYTADVSNMADADGELTPVDEAMGGIVEENHLLPIVKEQDLKNTYNTIQCEISWVTVYLDKAEVCRCVRPCIYAQMTSEVIFKGLSPAVDKDSIRVTVSGPGTIQDVIYSTQRIEADEDQWGKAKIDIKEEIKREQRQQEILQAKLHRLNKQRAVLDTFADALIKKDEEKKEPGAIKTENQGDIYDPKHMDTLRSFFSLYESQAEKLDNELLTTREELETAEAALNNLDKQLKDLDLRHDEHLTRDITVLIEGTQTTKVELMLSYVVTRVSWKPSYDVRIFNSDGNMKIIYYGLIQQATGEDWETNILSLSTLQPGTGGTVPQLGIQRIHFRSLRNDAPVLRRAKNRKQPRRVTKAFSFHARDNDRLSIVRDDATPSASDDNVNREETDMKSPTHESQHCSAGNYTDQIDDQQARGDTARGEHNTPHGTLRRPSPDCPVSSAQFNVPRPPETIPCDNEAHRVTLAIIDLQPSYEYVSVPKRSPYAFLKANVTNSSKYAFLPGPINIYNDNNFVGKSELKAVAPSEEFSCDLGAEHGIKINYNPMFKYREIPGTAGKSACVTFKQLIEVKNSHDRPVRILVMDQLPLSGEDKIKVSLLEPVIKHPEKYDRSKPVRISKTNNVEWDLELQAGEMKELVLKYSVEHPTTEEIDVCVSEA